MSNVACQIIMVALLPFAVWRLTSILLREEGPLGIAGKIRSLIGVYYDEFSNPCGDNVISRAFICMWCLSVWVSLAFILAIIYLPQLASVIVISTFGLSALAIMIDGKIGE